MFHVDCDIPDWGEYFLNLAETVSTRSACYRTHVGCVIVKDKRVLSAGYNSAPSGRTTCYELGYCHRDRNDITPGTKLEECISAGSHAESNAIYNAARHGISVEGSTLYLVGYDSCCTTCQAAILNAGIYKVIIRKKDGKKLYLYPKTDFSIHPILNV